MKHCFLFLIISIAFVSCSKTDENAKQEIINTDIAFSKRSIEKGMYAAFVEFADDSVIKPAQGEFPVFGKKALEEKFSQNGKPDFTLSWQPVKAEVAASGDLGYTFGNWKLQTKNQFGLDETVYGNYVSIWKKQKDGSWKYVLDTGNETPSPEL